MCQTCEDRKVVITDHGWGASFMPCPDCNADNKIDYKKRREEILAKWEEAKNDNPN